MIKELTKNNKYGKRVDAKIEEKINAKIEEKISALEAKMDTVEKRSSEAIGITCDDKNMKEKSRVAPFENKAVATGFKEDSEEKDLSE